MLAVVVLVYDQASPSAVQAEPIGRAKVCTGDRTC
jgi:hypothetical protein